VWVFSCLMVRVRKNSFSPKYKYVGMVVRQLYCRTWAIAHLKLVF